MSRPQIWLLAYHEKPRRAQGPTPRSAEIAHPQRGRGGGTWEGRWSREEPPGMKPTITIP